MTSIYFFTRPGESYSQTAVPDSRRAAINEKQRRAVCENRLFKACLEEAGLGHLHPDEIAISVLLGQNDAAPVLQFWKTGTGQRFTIDAEVYRKDPFLLQYVRHQIGLDATPPQAGEFSEEEIEPGAPTPASQTKAPKLREEVEQAQQAASKRAKEPLHELLKQQRKQMARMEKRFMKLINQLDRRHQETLQQLLDLREERREPDFDRFSDTLLHLSDDRDAADRRYAGLLRETHQTFRNMLNRSERQFADLLWQSEERHAHLQGQFERFRRDISDEYHALIRQMYLGTMLQMQMRDAEFQQFLFAREAAFADFADNAQRRFEALMNHQLETQAQFATTLDQRYGDLLDQVLADRARGDQQYRELTHHVLDMIRHQSQASRTAQQDLLAHQDRVNAQQAQIMQRLLDLITRQGPAARAPHLDGPPRAAPAPDSPRSSGAPSDIDTDSDLSDPPPPPPDEPAPLTPRYEQALEEATNLQAQLVQIQEQVREIEQQLQDRNQQLTTVTREQDALLEQRSIDKQQLQERQAQLDALTAEQGRLQAAVDEAQQQRQQAAVQVQELQARLGTMTPRASATERQEQVLAEAQALRVQLEEQRQQATTDIERLTQAQREMEGRLAVAQGEISQARAQIGAGEQQLQERQAQLDALTTEQGRLQAAVDEAQQQRQQAAAQVEQLETQLEVMTPRDNERQRAAETHQQFQEELEEAQRRLATATEQQQQAAAEAETLRQQLTTMVPQEHVQGLRRQLSEHAAQLVEVQREAQAAAVQHEAIRQQFQTATGNLVHSERNLQEARTQVAGLEQQIAGLAEENVGLTVGLAGILAELEAQRHKGVAIERPLQLTTSIAEEDLRPRVLQMALPLPGAQRARIIDQVPRAIREGALDGLVGRPEALDVVTGALKELLADSPESNIDILHLALYAAAHDQPALRNNSALFTPLLNWASRAAINGLDDQQKKKLDTLSLALSERPGTLCGPLSQAVDEGHMLSQIREEAGEGPKGQRNWARALLQKEEPTTDLERDLQRRLREDLESHMQPPVLYHYQTKRHLNLAEQLCSDIDPANPGNHLAVHCKRGRTDQELWLQSWNRREGCIADSIERILSPATFERRINEVHIHAKDRVLTPAVETPDDLWLAGFRARTLRNPSLSDEERLDFKNGMRDAILARLMGQSGLPCAQESCVDHLARSAVQLGDLPPFVKKVLTKKNQEEARTVGNLLYNYIALSTPPRKGHEQIACDEDWKWLQQEVSPEEGTRRLMRILQQKQQMPKLCPPEKAAFAYPLTRKQADWVHNFARAFAGKSANPLYEDAGAGKTSIAELAIRCFRADNQPVYLLSPFQTSMPGVQAIQFRKGQKEHTIDVPAAGNLENAVVIVDEAHVLDPDAEVVLRHGNQTRTASPLLMTATPIVPQGTYAQFKRSALVPKYLREADAISRKLEEVERAVQREMEGLRQEYIARYSEKILSGIAVCTRYMPNARKHYVDKLDPQPKSIETLSPWKEQLGSWLKECKNDLEPYLTIKGQKLAFDQGRPLFQRVSADLSLLINALRQTADQMDLSALAQKNPRIPELVQERDRLTELRNSIRRKVAKWAQAEDVNAERYEKVRTQQQRLLSQMEYHPSRRITDVHEAAQFAAQSPAVSERVSQLIFPGIAFNQVAFPQLTAPIQTMPLVYHTAEDRVLQNGTETAFNAAQLTQGKVAMLYDTTNAQGGDFGALSMAQPERGHDISQAIFTQIQAPDSGITVTMSDLIQWSGRRRGTSALPSHIYGTQGSKEEFLATASQNQADLEHRAALQVAARKIARKALKITALTHPEPSYQEALRRLTAEQGASALAEAKTALQAGSLQNAKEGLLHQALITQSRDWKVWVLQDQMQHFATWYAQTDKA